ncbi:bifunctional phosphopantothenoylcysteine decarboxylase/phosphopantothenate--cysteine ligase CoaBC [Plantibacter sp. YIM 135347]|uniref:bifunctional phosphopantothenoylcysteine decarboxylase/phosphopantothenate--cysteine ligase CoaBC n=1 Tax=Plantibacter sp. YIM 135347 TaxID=3423919 RepID=UPI003D332567
MKIIVGVTGGIAAYKSVTIVRQLVTAGHDVTVIPTESALRFVGTPTWEAASRNAVTTSVHDDVARVRHVALGQEAELIIIAPTTANFIAKFAAGLADDLLGTTLLATKAPVVLAPAMHTEMWLHPSTVDNVATLRRRGVHVVGPESGALTGGDEGPGRMTEPADIVAFGLGLLDTGTSPQDGTAQQDSAAPQDLAGLRVVVSAGGTREPIDPVRFLGNRSSGRQGVAVAAAAAARGAHVTLVAANVSADVLAALPSSTPVHVRSVGTAAELAAEVNTLEDEADVIVMAAAVADYRPVTVSDGKLTKDVVGDRLTIELVANPDILAGLVDARRVGQTIVGFAAETSSSHEELLERGRRKRARKGVDLLALNAVGWDAGFETLDNTLVIIGSDDAVIAESSGSKRVVADALWDAVLTTRL